MIVRLLKNHNAQNKIKTRDDNEEDHLRSWVLSLMSFGLDSMVQKQNKIKKKSWKNKYISRL